MPRPKKTAAKAAAATEKEIVAVAETETAAVAAEEKKPAAKKTVAKKESAPKKAAVESKVVIQANGSEAVADELTAKAIAASGVKTVKKVGVYVRPEINKVYYVINGDVLGEFNLF